MPGSTAGDGPIGDFVSGPEELESVRSRAVDFVSDRLSTSGKEGAVVVIDGDLNAAVVTILAVEALGKDHVFGLILPSYRYTEAKAFTAELLAKGLGIEYESTQLLPYVHLFRELSVPETNRAEGVAATDNAIDRMKMATAYYAAETTDRLVLGSEDRTEWLLGSVTKNGVRRGDLLPIGHLYRTEVERLADHVGIPDDVWDAGPPGALRSSTQIDVGQATIDSVLRHLVDEDMSISQTVSELDIEREAVVTIAERHANSRHMREPPRTPETDVADRYDRFHEVELRFD